jgi:hypothetical protein
VTPHEILRQKVDEWAAKFGITVSKFEHMSYGPYAKFIGTTDDGERMPIGCFWGLPQDQPYHQPHFAVWLDSAVLGITGEGSISLESLKGFHRAFARLDTRAGRKWKRHNR